ncbi:AaceriAEL104Wp [[Ashbya] aceris (nom. inval.)]|nr:AaceriAEL104Wp [[Ashbya] aceris (nom. inval.)]
MPKETLKAAHTMSNEMMGFTTPVIEYYAKFAHSPPSRGSTSGGSPTAKFLKTLSGGSIRRLSGRFRRSSSSSGVQRPPISSPQPINRIPSVVQRPSIVPPVSLQGVAPPKMQDKKRPKPLDLRMVSPPLTVQMTPRYESGFQLGEPLECHPSKAESDELKAHKKPGLDTQGLGISTHQYALSKYDRAQGSHKDEILPSSLAANNTHISTNGIPGCKRYTSNVCSICGENLNALLAGERIVELSCDHQSHYHCYITLLEVSIHNEKYPRCQTCGQERKPKDDEILTNMKSSILLTKPLTSTHVSSIRAQVLGPTSAMGEKPMVNIYTPCEQIVKSADVASNGFCSPYHDSMHCTINSDDVTLEFPLSTTDSDPGSISPLPIVEDRVKVNVIPQMNKLTVDDTVEEVIVPFVLNCCVPGLKKEEIDVECLTDQSLRAEINEYLLSKFPSHLNKPSPLRIFDRLNYSLDGEQWTSVVVYYFEKCLLLVQQEHTEDVDPVIIGKIPMEHFSRLHKYSINTILLDLKSISLPEVYLQDPSGSTALIDKWNFYLSNLQSKVPVALQTTNCWQLLPQCILDKVPKELISYNQLTGDALGLTASLDGPFVAGKCGAASCAKPSKLQIVVAVSLTNCNPELHSNEELLQIIQRQLRSLKSSLHENDLLGLVVASKQGFSHGKFYGMVSKDWELWDEIIEDMRVSGYRRAHMSDVKELQYILETSNRLLSMVEDPSDYIRQLVILGNDYQVHAPPEPSAIKTGTRHSLEQLTIKVLEEYKFSITQFVTHNSHTLLRNHADRAYYNVRTEQVEHLSDIDCQELIHELHQKSVPQVQIELQSFDRNIATFQSIENKGKLVPCLEDSLSLQIGCLKPGESRSLIFEMRVDIRGLRRHLGDKHALLAASPGRAEPRPSLSLVRCHYAPAFAPARRRASCAGVAFSFDCRRASPIVSPVASPLGPQPASATAPDDDLYVDIPLVAPLTPARDAVFVARQLQLLVADALANLGVEHPRPAPCVAAPARLRELVSVLFGMSRDCAYTVPAYVQDARPALDIHQHTEALCKKLEQIVDAHEHGGQDTGAVGMPRWAQLARALYISLM